MRIDLPQDPSIFGQMFIQFPKVRKGVEQGQSNTCDGESCQSHSKYFKVIRIDFCMTFPQFIGWWSGAFVLIRPNFDGHPHDIACK